MSFIGYNSLKNATVEVFALCYNEAGILRDFIDHYKKHFAAEITIFDNYSTDNSRNIIEDNGCTCIPYDSNNEINEHIYLNIKNHCWKQSTADFVIVVDIDEFLEVEFNCSKYSIINTKGYDMIGALDSRLGAENTLFNKTVMFRPKYIKEINYKPGCHACDPQGVIYGSKEIAKLLHRKYISERYLYKKHLEYEKRLSKFNKHFNFGEHYENTTVDKIKKMFSDLASMAKHIN